LIRWGANPVADHNLQRAIVLRLANRIVPNREDNVMPNELAAQKEAYLRVHPRLLAEKKSGWALVARGELVDVFLEFDAASSFADKNYPNEQVLIRHTAEQAGIAPFIMSAR
jgi:hypothetical protein